MIIVIVSFVLYLSQGTSVFDFMSDPNREEKIFYGTDLNDPEERRLLSITNQVAADLGAIISPTKEVLEKADARYFENLQNQLRAAYQPENRDKVDQEALQNMFGYMQSWRNFPDAVKVMAIARSGDYDYEFSESSIRAKLVMDSLARDFAFLPLEINHSAINSFYHDFIKSLNPILGEDENRSIAFANLARFRGVTPRDVDSILYDHYRSHQMDRVFNGSGFTLDAEGEIEGHRDRFAWDAQAILISSEDFDFKSPSLASILMKSVPEAGTKLEIDLGRGKHTYEFVAEPKEANGTKRYLPLGKDASSCLKSLAAELTASKVGLVAELSEDGISLSAEPSALGRKSPTFSSSSKNLAIDFSLEPELRDLHRELRSDPQFVEPARTYASAISFETGDFHTPLPEPDEARMRAYFERNKVLFEPLPEAPGTDTIVDENVSLTPKDEEAASDRNQSAAPEVTFEEVRDEVRRRIVEGDKMDAEREAEELAKEAALDFLEVINSLGDRLVSKYASYQDLRKSGELEEALKESGGKVKRVSFSEKDMSLQARILGLERRESERRSNREPLQEVQALNEKLFFTRSVRSTKTGYAVFILDRKTKEKPSDFAKVDFSLLYSELIGKQRTKAFNDWADEQFARLSNPKASFEKGKRIVLKAKSGSMARASYDLKSSKLRSQIQRLQEQRSESSKLVRDKNATQADLKRKAEIDAEIEKIRQEQATLNQERSLTNRLLEVVDTLEPNGEWVEQERTEESALFVRLSGVYTLLPEQADPEQVKGRVREIEFFKAENARSLLVQDLIAAGLDG